MANKERAAVARMSTEAADAITRVLAACQSKRAASLHLNEARYSVESMQRAARADPEYASVDTLRGADVLDVLRDVVRYVNEHVPFATLTLDVETHETLAAATHKP